MEDNGYRTCYVVNFWLGDRRRTTENVKNDKLYLLRKQIEILQTVKHNLNKIVLNFNVETVHYKYLSEIFELTPKSIQGADIEINIRENYGISYGAWSDVFEKYKTGFDYYIFTEDDYFFIEDNWDEYLVNKHDAYDDCGYLCMFLREPHSWNDHRKIAGSSVGISSSKTLMKIFTKHGKLPSLQKSDSVTDVYKDGHDIQNKFGYSFIEAGLNVYDVRDEYKIMFSKGEPPELREHIDVWTFFNWNEKFLSVSVEYFNDSYSYYNCFDLEFQLGYNPTTNKEAIYCYNNKEMYYEEDKNEIKWLRRKYPKNI